MERLLLISSYPLHSISSQWPMFTAPWSAAPSDMFWDLTGSVGCVSTMDSDCLNRSCVMNFQRVQLLSEMHNLWDGRGFPCGQPECIWTFSRILSLLMHVHLLNYSAIVTFPQGISGYFLYSSSWTSVIDQTFCDFYTSVSFHSVPEE